MYLQSTHPCSAKLSKAICLRLSSKVRNALRVRCAHKEGVLHKDVKNHQGLHTITFKTPSGSQVVAAPKGANIYTAADHAGLHLPASCKQGSCSSCVCKVVGGKVTYTQEPQCLTSKLNAKGFVAICCASVAGDATIVTHQGAKLRAARMLQLDRMRHQHG